ncbi:MAG: glycosyltransferase family 39 protein [Ardenticatenia bacterium]|nr:glycosyltransferase family 39 protein [Ardenticatenia bacterium]
MDEVPHFQYVVYLKERRTLPVQPWGDNGRPLDVFMGHHPPLYYALAALFIFPLDTSDLAYVMQPNPHFRWVEFVPPKTPPDGWTVYLHTPAEAWPFRGTVLAMHVLRLVGVLLGAVALLAIFATARLVLPHQPWIALTATALTAFNPAFIFMSATVHHDVLLSALGALILWWAVRTVRLGAQGARWWLLGGVLIGAAMLTKLSGLVFLGVGLSALLLKWWRDRDRCRFLAGGGVLIITVVTMAGWWYARNWVLYDDPLGWQMFLQTQAHMVRTTPYTWFTFRYEFLGQLARTFWGAFGYMHVLLPRRLWSTLWALAGLATVGWTAGLVVARLRRHTFNRANAPAWALLLGAALGLFVSFVRFSVATTGAGHGRYLFPVATALMLAMATGVHTMFGLRAQPAVTLVTALGMFGYAVLAPALYVWPLYTPERLWPKTLLPDALPANAVPVGVRYGEAIELAAVAWEPARVLPGEQSTLTLYWRPLGTRRPDLFMRLRLLDRYGTPFVAIDDWPQVSSSTVAWDPALLYVVRRTFTVPEGVPLGRTRLSVEVTRGRQGAPIPPVAPDRLAAVPSLLLGRPPPTANSSPTAQPRHERLGEQIALRGLDLPRTTWRPGEYLQVTLYWEALAPVADNYTVFVQVLNAEGKLVAQHDIEPANGTFPTSTWEAGTLVPDEHQLLLPENLPAGTYTLIAGMYAYPSLQRLPVTLDEHPMGDFILLAQIEITP